MEFKFNINGSIEALATEENKAFLTKVGGNLQQFGDSKIEKVGNIYHVVDNDGHPCRACRKYVKSFFLIEDEIICYTCITEK